MGTRVTVNGMRKDLFVLIRKEFVTQGSNRVIKKSILEDLKAGVSPVRGKKWQKYSDSYKSVIRGEKTFRTVKIQGQNVVKARSQPDENFFSLAAIGGKKSISPVNLRLTGELWNSLSVKALGDKLIVAFEDFIALVHNNLGVRSGRGFKGPKILRRLLPTEEGEKFNDKITQVVEDQVKKAVDAIVNLINRQ